MFICLFDLKCFVANTELVLLFIGSNPMAKSENVFVEWQRTAVKDEDIPKLREDVLSMYRDQGVTALLPFYGFLYFKDKIWTGSLEKVTYLGGGSRMPGSAALSTEFYVAQFKPKFIDELKALEGDGSVVVDVETSTFVTCLSISSFCEEETSRSSFTSNIISASSDSSVAFEKLTFCRSDILKYIPIPAETSLNVTAHIAILHNNQCPKYTVISSNVPGYVIREMTLREALFAIEKWKFASSESKLRFTSSYSNGLAIGAFPVGGEFPVSWVFGSWEGAMAALETLTDHRRRGLGRAVIKELSRRLIDRGLIPYVFIETIETSYMQESFFDGLGFTVYKDVFFRWIRPPNAKSSVGC